MNSKKTTWAKAVVAAFAALALAACALVAAPAPEALADSGTEKIELRSVWNPNTGEHLYTSDQNEIKTLQGLGWNVDDGVKFRTATSGVEVYRFRAPNQIHVYVASSSTNEVNTLTRRGWDNEGVAFYSVLGGNDSNATRVYTEFSPNDPNGSHNYTTSLYEHNQLKNLGWEGTTEAAFWALK